MRSTAKIALTSLIIAMIGAIAATTAQANEGPFYEEGGIRLEEGEKLEQTEAAKTSLNILAKAGQAITCTGAPFASGATPKRIHRENREHEHGDDRIHRL